MIWVESISSSHSASSQLSGEFMLLYSIHTLANLAVKETVPPQSRTSTQVTVKKIYIQYREFTASASCSKILNVKSILNTMKNVRANSVFQGKRRVAQKSWMVRNIFNTVEILRENCFWRQGQVAQKSWTVKIFSIQYIQCIFTWGDPCNLD